MTNVMRIQRVHHKTPGRCYEYGRATAKRTVVVHLSLGGTIWWQPDVGRKRYSGITEYRAGWLLVAVQVAHKTYKAQT